MVVCGIIFSSPEQQSFWRGMASGCRHLPSGVEQEPLWRDTCWGSKLGLVVCKVRGFGTCCKQLYPPLVCTLSLMEVGQSFHDLAVCLPLDVQFVLSVLRFLVCSESFDMYPVVFKRLGKLRVALLLYHLNWRDLARLIMKKENRYSTQINYKYKKEYYIWYQRNTKDCKRPLLTIILRWQNIYHRRNRYISRYIHVRNWIIQ